MAPLSSKARYARGLLSYPAATTSHEGGTYYYSRESMTNYGCWVMILRASLLPFVATPISLHFLTFKK